MKAENLKVGNLYVVAGAGECCVLIDLAGSLARRSSTLHKFRNEHGQLRYARSVDVLREACEPVKGGAQ